MGDETGSDGRAKKNELETKVSQARPVRSASRGRSPLTIHKNFFILYILLRFVQASFEIRTVPYNAGHPGRYSLIPVYAFQSFRCSGNFLVLVTG